MTTVFLLGLSSSVVVYGETTCLQKDDQGENIRNEAGKVVASEELNAAMGRLFQRQDGWNLQSNGEKIYNSVTAYLEKTDIADLPEDIQTLDCSVEADALSLNIAEKMTNLETEKRINLAINGDESVKIGEQPLTLERLNSFDRERYSSLGKPLSEKLKELLAVLPDVQKLRSEELETFKTEELAPLQREALFLELINDSYRAAQVGIMRLRLGDPELAIPMGADNKPDYTKYFDFVKSAVMKDEKYSGFNMDQTIKEIAQATVKLLYIREKSALAQGETMNYRDLTLKLFTNPDYLKKFNEELDASRSRNSETGEDVLEAEQPEQPANPAPADGPAGATPPSPETGAAAGVGAA